MGLDMYMYKIDRLTDDEILDMIGISSKDIDGKYHYLNKETVDGDPDMYSDLLPFVTEISVIDTLFNGKLCFDDHDIADDDQVCGSFQSRDQIAWVFSSGAKVELTRAEYEKYLYETKVPMYIFKAEQVAYWRKHYDLHDFLETVRIVCRAKQFVDENGTAPTDEDIKFWTTENCGYYMLGAGEKLALKEYLADNKELDDEHCADYHFGWDGLINDPNSVLMYHAWW